MEEASIQLPLIPNNCPLCNSMVKLYFINFDEKIVMCENTECDYPFGHEDIKFYKESGDAHSGVEAFSFRSPNTASVAPSTISASAWADIDHINKVYESEDNRPDLKSTKEPRAKKQKTQTEKENEEQLNKNVENIKQLTKALIDNSRNVQCINNEKWIKNLMSKQVCGMKLLRQGEITKLKKTEQNFGTAELKIDINPSPDNLSSITIEIANYSDI